MAVTDSSCEKASKLSGKGPLHVILYRGNLNTKGGARHLPEGAISNELVVPIRF